MKRRMTALILALLLVGLVAGAAWAMSSPNHRLDWYEIPPGASSVTNNSQSAAVRVYDSFGPFGVAHMSSSGSDLTLGYWPGAMPKYSVFQPLMLRYR